MISSEDTRHTLKVTVVSLHFLAKKKFFDCLRDCQNSIGVLIIMDGPTGPNVTPLE